MDEGFSLLLTALSAALGWFNTILNRGNFAGYLLAAMFIIFSWRFLLSPILSRGSDSAARKRDDDRG